MVSGHLSNERCDIIIPVWNREEDTKECIESVERNTRYPYRLIIVDNASTEPTASYLERFAENADDKRTVIIKNEKNEGFVRGVNIGIRASDAPFICIMNNDTIPARGWLGEMVKVAQGNDAVGIVNPSSNTLGQNIGKKNPNEYAASILKDSGRHVELGSAFGFCMLVKRKVFDTIGLFDEAYGMGYFEDTDFSLRAKSKGYGSVRALASYVHHKESRSFNMLKTFKRDFNKNKELFETRWGRTRRVMVILKEMEEGKAPSLGDLISQNARENSWVYVVSPYFETGKYYERYSNLTFYHFRNYFYILLLRRAVFRRKRLDVIYCDNPMVLRFLSALKSLHGAEIRDMKTEAYSV